ncbi:hypothetical protein PINS_up001848 [Pythium insidiosum]|nr:hypothetical protein PINS_up001848 [Pythium insidiosum]
MEKDDRRSAHSRRPSDIFVEKSRSLEDVNFSSPRHAQNDEAQWSPAQLQTPQRRQHQDTVNIESQNDGSRSDSESALGSDYEIHVDSRHALTPNSIKYLQSLEHMRSKLLTQHENPATMIPPEYAASAHQLVRSKNSTEVTEGLSDVSEEPSPAREALLKGPPTIKRALHEIEAMLVPLAIESDSSDESESESPITRLKLTLHSKCGDAITNVNLDESRSNRERNDATLSANKHDDDTVTPQTNGHAPLPPKIPSSPQFVAGNAFSNVGSVEVTTRGVEVEFVPRHASAEDTKDHHRQPGGITPGHSVEQLEVKRGKDTGVQVGRLPTPSYQDASTITDQHQRRPRVTSKFAEDGFMNANNVDELSACTKLSDDDEGFAPLAQDAATTSSHAKGPTSRPPIPSRKTAHRGTTVGGTRADSFALNQPGQFGSVHPQVQPTARSGIRRKLQPELWDTERDKQNGRQFRPTRKEITNRAVSSDVIVPQAVAMPAKMSRRCRRLLCSVGEHMVEHIMFSNGANAVGRICVALLPLSKGCQQFTVTPAVLELQPLASGAFVITFSARYPGVVAGIFQFRAVGTDSLFEPYEVMIEASVRGDIEVKSKHASKPPIAQPPIQAAPVNRIRELSAEDSQAVVIGPTFIKFEIPRDTGNEPAHVGSAQVRMTNGTDKALPFEIKCDHEHLSVSPSRGSIEPNSETSVRVKAFCQPYGRDGHNGGAKWVGSMTVVVGTNFSREVSVVIDSNALAALPLFEEALRIRHALSTQTDSFYYTKKGRRKGLYFHARAVECGSCPVGESHQVPVYICNGSDAPMTVFLQTLQEPFACSYSPTTLQARKFIEVPVTFRPKTVGKVATCLVAYSATGKAVVTLVARGIPQNRSQHPLLTSE